MHVPEIIEVKNLLTDLQKRKVIAIWELPYENLLTRRSAAIFFFTPTKADCIDLVLGNLSEFDNFSFRPNSEKTLSKLDYRVTFSKEEKEKNAAMLETGK